MIKELNDAQVNKVDNAKKDEKKVAPDVEFGCKAGVALIDAFNKTMDERGGIKVGDTLLGLGGAVSTFVWKLLNDYEPFVRYSAMREVARSILKASRERIFDNDEE